MNLAEITRQLEAVLQALAGKVDLDLGKFDVSVAADAKFGDFATNAAMVYAKDLKRPPRELAEQLAAQLKKKLNQADKVEVAGPGFINITLSDVALARSVQQAPLSRPDDYAGQVVVAEYGDPNPFKVLHAGHLYTSVVGEAIANLLEYAGATVHRVNFGGDVGLHVAKAIWGILYHETDGDISAEDVAWAKTAAKAAGSLSSRAAWIASRYVDGNTAYENDGPAGAMQQIGELNQRIYALHDKDDPEAPLSKIYWTCRNWSYEYFEEFYARLGTKFEKYYPESECAKPGMKAVRKELAKGVYEESDGAVVFRGEKYGLHTRVFITSRGIPTYETKDVGLIIKKWEDYHFDRSIVITDNGQAEYMAVVLKSLEQYLPKLAKSTTHLTHGVVKLKGGVKMSSRKGNVLLANDVLDIAQQASGELNSSATEETTIGAVKYAFLKQRLGGDVVYDSQESVSLEGNSGPYLQYAHARARSIMAKSKRGVSNSDTTRLEPAERLLARAISQYPNVVQQAVNEILPHYLCTYLYELAQVFNRFYEGNRVVGDERESERIMLVGAYADVLKSGLKLLGMAAPERI